MLQPYTVHEIKLQLERIIYALPCEWVMRARYHDTFQCVELELSRYIKEHDLDEDERERVYETVHYNYDVVVPCTAIDYLRVWLSKTFPLMTAPLWTPKFKTVVRYGSAEIPVVRTYRKWIRVVAPPSTERFKWVTYSKWGGL